MVLGGAERYCWVLLSGVGCCWVALGCWVVVVRFGCGDE